MKKKPSLKVRKVEEGSLSAMHNVLPGDRLVMINGHAIHDIIDYQFYSADDVLDCTFLREEKEKRVHFEKAFDQTLGLEFEPFQFRKCANHCIFCFCDQNPKSVRSPLRFKDEDFRLSFLYGNYYAYPCRKAGSQRIVNRDFHPSICRFMPLICRFETVIGYPSG